MMCKKYFHIITLELNALLFACVGLFVIGNCVLHNTVLQTIWFSQEHKIIDQVYDLILLRAQNNRSSLN